MASELLPVIASILIVGLGVQLLAQRLQVPSVIFYLVAGLIMGPEVLGLVTPATFGNGLETIVGLSVAIIVFDGAFALKIERVREAETVALRLVTIGAVVTFVGTTVAVRVLEGTSWELALVAGALLVATGPTVITPILEVVRVREHVSAALETEGIVNDVTAAIMAVVIFETLLLDDLGVEATVVEFFFRISVGVGAGVMATVIIYLLLEGEITPGKETRTAEFLILSAAIGSFALAETVAAEAGIAAAATSGIVLGNLELDHEEELEEFARNATLIVLAFVFVSLAAFIDVGAIVNLGVGAIALVLIVMLVLRPVVALIATAGVDRFNRSERFFLAAVGPRGIIPASVATLFAIELEQAGNVEAGQILVGVVFAVIFATVMVEAGLARQVGDQLGVTPMRTIIIGSGRVGRALAQRLENRGEFVVIVDDDEEEIARARGEDFTVVSGDGTEPDVLREAGIREAKRVVAATQTDNDNLLVCQLARSKFGIEHVLSRVNQPENMDAFSTLGVTAIDSPTATATAIDDEIERPALSHWMNQIGDGHDVQEIEVTASDLVGRTIREVNEDIPDGCIVAVIGRDGESHVPDADDALEYGDHITFIGEEKAVRQAMKRFHPHD
ncbi:cation:proton antiporter domain-containing protein [Halovenus sp. HT40]|uniref:cation:proton antiporter domain-containing protein n=1 Tax=Halovenus sp. HT40 TaxID=3126691 RepID=UPI00300F52D1